MASSSPWGAERRKADATGAGQTARPRGARIPAMTSRLITNARILDGTGREPFAGSVRIDGPRIAEVSPALAPAARAGEAVIDARGAVLMPGLIESHAHLSFADVGSHELTRLPPEEHVLVTVRNARTMLDSGYTSAVSAAAAKPRLDVVLKREIDAGRVPGPRLLANGPEITVTGGLGDNNLLHLPPHETPTFAWVADGMEVARAAGLRVAAHCRSAESVLSALRHGVEVIYHANYADERALDALEAARDGIFVGPALGITYNLTQAGGQWGVTPERARAFERELAISVEAVARMRKRGIRILPGGDYGFVFTPHGTYARDLWVFV